MNTNASTEVPCREDQETTSLVLLPEEREELRNVLANYLADLRYEIADTDNSDFKRMLRQRQQTLSKILDSLGPAETAHAEGT